MRQGGAHAYEVQRQQDEECKPIPSYIKSEASLTHDSLSQNPVLTLNKIIKYPLIHLDMDTTQIEHPKLIAIEEF